MMQLDDVVSSTITGPRVEEAMRRSIRWLDRCIAANKNPDRQNLFAIIQGGLNAELRKACLEGMRYAIHPDRNPSTPLPHPNHTLTIFTFIPLQHVRVKKCCTECVLLLLVYKTGSEPSEVEEVEKECRSL